MSFEHLLSDYMNKGDATNCLTDGDLSSSFIGWLLQYVHEKSTTVIESVKSAPVSLSNVYCNGSDISLGVKHADVNGLVEKPHGAFFLSTNETVADEKHYIKSLLCKKEHLEDESNVQNNLNSTENNQHQKNKPTLNRLHTPLKPSKGFSTNSEFDISSSNDFPSLLDPSSRVVEKKSKTFSQKHSRRRIKPTTISKSKINNGRCAFELSATASHFNATALTTLETDIELKHKTLLSTRLSNSGRSAKDSVEDVNILLVRS